MPGKSSLQLAVMWCAVLLSIIRFCILPVPLISYTVMPCFVTFTQ